MLLAIAYVGWSFLGFEAAGSVAEEVDEPERNVPKAITIGADVADSNAVRDAFERVETELGPIDAVHNNAGISIVTPLADTTDDVFRRLVDINLAGSFFVLREAARVMQSRRAGAIVNTASELALIGQAGYVAYTATKGAILAMTRSAAAELASCLHLLECLHLAFHYRASLHLAFLHPAFRLSYLRPS